MQTTSVRFICMLPEAPNASFLFAVFLIIPSKFLKQETAE